MITLDTNILISANREDASFHGESLALLNRIAKEGTPLALFWPVLYGFVRVVTHHRAFTNPTSLETALKAVSVLVSLPNARLLPETERHAEILARVLRESGASGNLVSDAHIVALAVEHGVDEILTFDGDFARFRQVRSRHPFRP